MKWKKLSDREKLKWVLKCQMDPLAFQEIVGLKLFPKQAEIVQKFYNGPYNELVLVAGMRSGKTTTAAYLSTYETFLFLTADYSDKRSSLIC